MPNQYLDYGCCNVVDGCRTLRYAATRNHPISDTLCSGVITSCKCCVTPDVDELPESGSFVSPEADPAPWYEPTDPRSSHYLGPMIVDWKESQPYLRETVDTTTGGRTKRAKLQRKEVVVTFMLVVDDACAIDFAKAYFLNQFICTSTTDACTLPALEWHECYNKDNCNDFAHSMRGFSGAALTNLVWLDDELPPCIGVMCEATFAADLPWIYEMCPETLVEDLLIVTGLAVCNICEDPCPEVVNACINPCLPVSVDIPAVTLDTCYCDPYLVTRQAFKIDPDPRIGESTLNIKINTGSGIMRNFRLKAWTNVLGATDASVYRCEDPCIDIAVAEPVPANSVIEIDGLSRNIYITCNNVKSSGRNWVESPDGSPLSWPDITCDGLLVSLDASAVVSSAGVPHTAADATISIDRYHRELR